MMVETAFILLMNSILLMLRIAPGDSFPKPLSRAEVFSGGLRLRKNVCAGAVICIMLLHNPIFRSTTINIITRTVTISSLTG